MMNMLDLDVMRRFIRLCDDGFYYEAILRDTRAQNSELICLLRDIHELQKG